MPRAFKNEMMKAVKHFLIAIVAFVILDACAPAGGEFAGSEYMPDMGHSVANEANVYSYYYYNTWDSASTFKLYDLSAPRKPVAGTIARGYAGVHYARDSEREDVMATLNGRASVNTISVPVNGNVPYYYEDTEEERARATAEILDNPFPITEDGLARGENLYNIFCGICHGVKGDGVGYLVADENPNVKYPAAPANFLLEEFVNASNGRYYHAVMYGKNVMGGYADKLSYEERWQVIHWIRALQAKELKVEYDQQANTLNPAFGEPAGTTTAMAQPASDKEAPTGEAAPANEPSQEGQGGDQNPPADQSDESHSGDRK